MRGSPIGALFLQAAKNGVAEATGRNGSKVPAAGVHSHIFSVRLTSRSSSSSSRTFGREDDAKEQKTMRLSAEQRHVLELLASDRRDAGREALVFVQPFDRDTIAGLIRTGPQRVILKAGDKVVE
jgi:hypothetical protein